MVNDKYCILIPVYNRCNVTRDCLYNLDKHLIIKNEIFEIVVIDDGSSDGTSEMLKNEFPQITVLKGNGNLFWGGAMELGMKYALKKKNGVIWLNDDCLISRKTLEVLIQRIEVTKGICAARCFEDNSFSIETYNKIQSENTDFLEQRWIAGNCVVIHYSVLISIGVVNSKDTIHYAADTIYSLIASNSGIKVEISREAKAINPSNKNQQKITKFRELKKALFYKGSSCNFHSLFLFYRKAYPVTGFIRFVKFIFMLIINVFLSK